VWDKNHKPKATRHSLTSFYRREIKSWKILRISSIYLVKIDLTSSRSLFWLRLKFLVSRTKFLSGRSTAMKSRLFILIKTRECKIHTFWFQFIFNIFFFNSVMSFLQRILISQAKLICLSMTMKSSTNFFLLKKLKFKMLRTSTALATFTIEPTNLLKRIYLLWSNRLLRKTA